MQTPESSLESLANRVAKLEAQSRRLKKAGIASFIFATAVIAMGQAPPKKVIEANEFVLQDASGKTRAVLDMQSGDKPTLTLRDASGTTTVALAGGDAPLLHVGREGGKEHFLVAAVPGIGPFLSLSDGEGFQTAIGSTDLITPRTGETHRTSAASVVLLGKDKGTLVRSVKSGGEHGLPFTFPRAASSSF